MSKSDGRLSRRTYLYRESPPAASGQRGNALFRFRIHNPARGKSYIRPFSLSQRLLTGLGPALTLLIRINLPGKATACNNAYQNQKKNRSHNLIQSLILILFL